jgi:hypothetical protein
MERNGFALRREANRREWRRHVEAWAQGKQTQAAYCREHGLNYSLFIYWRRRLRQPEPTVVKLVPVGLPRAWPNGGCTPARLKLIIDGRFTLEINPGFDAPTLSQLIAVLGQA